MLTASYSRADAVLIPDQLIDEPAPVTRGADKMTMAAVIGSYKIIPAEVLAQHGTGELLPYARVDGAMQLAHAEERVECILNCTNSKSEFDLRAICGAGKKEMCGLQTFRSRYADRVQGSRKGRPRVRCFQFNERHCDLLLARCDPNLTWISRDRKEM